MNKIKVNEESRIARRVIGAVGIITTALIIMLAVQNVVGRGGNSSSSSPVVAMPSFSAGRIKYTGPIWHVFFHSLVIYPDQAFKNDARGKMYEDYMITKQEFVDFIDELYKDDFVLVDLRSLYTSDATGKVMRSDLYIPKGKRPLIISLDDLNYYSAMSGRGFADKLVIDQHGDVATEVNTPQGSKVITRDGDVVPILDDFVKMHPDFSIDGVKGTIAVTGFEGILGYRTQLSSPDRATEIESAKRVIERLEGTGWQFASHSYGHDDIFQNGTITLDELKKDTEQWRNEVESIVGPTEIFVGPFGQVFKPNDPRRDYLVSQGFKMLCGVGTDFYLQYTPTYVMMDRADIDGYRLHKDPARLNVFLNTSAAIESLMRYFKTR